jgi:hypothetical protein
MPVIYGAVDLARNELRNAVVQNLGAAPSSPTKGLLWFDSTNNILKWYDGTTWQSAIGGVVPPATATVLGTIQLAGDLTGTATAPVIANGAVTSVKILDGTIAVADTATAFDLGALATAHPTTTDVALNSHKLTGLATPTAGTDGVNKNYVDGAIQGLDAKASVHAATTGNIASFTAAPNTLDGVTLAIADRVLVKDQTTASQNGIYTVGSVGTGANGVWNRALDMDFWGEVPSAYTWVEQGTVNGDTGWLCTADVGGTIDSTAMPWVQFSGAGQVNAGAGLTKTGNTIDAVATDTTLTIVADSIAVNTAVIATQAYVNNAVAGTTKKFAAALTGTASPEVVTHNLNTRDIQLTVLNGASPYTAVEVDWDATSLTQATIRYNPNLGAGYRVVIVG